MLEYVESLQRVLSEVGRVLAPEGRLAVATPALDRRLAFKLLRTGFDWRFDPLAPPARHFTRETLAYVLGLAGFDPRWQAIREGTLLTVAAR